METVRAYWRQFEESATEFVYRLYHDVFFRTEVVIIGTLFILCFLYLTIIAIATHYLHLDVAGAVIQNITSTITSGVSNLESKMAHTNLISEINTIRNTYIFMIGGASLIATLLFGYVAARIALSPTRNALHAQKQFISNIAHELRTPLSILKTNNEILLIERADDIEMHTTVRHNIEELDRISDIINNLLTLNSFTHAKQLTFDSVDLPDIARDTVQKLSNFAESKKIKVTVFADTEINVWGNKSALEQIAVNLLENAIHYTSENGSVTVSTTRSSKHDALLEVRDNGIGIEAEKLKRIFEPFYRADPSRTRSKGGYGLGLAIINDLVKLHRGKISIRSTLGIGTLVRVELPINPTHTEKT